MRLWLWIVATWCWLWHRDAWKSKFSTLLFFGGRTRKGVTFYTECQRCGRWWEDS